MVITYLGNNLFYPGILYGITLNFSKLDSKTSQLNLKVQTTHIFNVTVLIVSAKISGVIHGDSGNYGAICKCSPGKIISVPVAISHILSCIAYFSGNPLRKNISVGIKDKCIAVFKWLTYGHRIIITPFFKLIVKYNVRYLCCTADIKYVNVTSGNTS